MKADSVGLEVYIEINPQELEELRKGSLDGLLNFRDNINPDAKREIPFSIEYSAEQREFLAVEQEPDNVYFGEANKIRFMINSEYYGSLITNKSFGARFSVGGKLMMKLKGS